MAAHRVYLRFALPRRLTFSSSDKIETLAERRALSDLEGKQMLEQAVRSGRGGCYLRLSPEKFAKLR